MGATGVRLGGLDPINVFDAKRRSRIQMSFGYTRQRMIRDDDNREQRNCNCNKCKVASVNERVGRWAGPHPTRCLLVWTLIEGWKSTEGTEAVEVDRRSLESHVSVASIEWGLLLEVELL